MPVYRNTSSALDNFGLIVSTRLFLFGILEKGGKVEERKEKSR